MLNQPPGGGQFQTVRSLDGGSSWTELGQIGNFQPQSGFVPGAALHIAVDSGDSSRLFAAIFGCERRGCEGGVHRSVNGGVSWERVLEAGDLFNVLFDPTDPDVLYAGSGQVVGRGVFKTTDGGDSWQTMNAGLPDVEDVFGVGGELLKAIQNLVVDPRNPQHLYTRLFRLGMYRTTDGAASWSPYLAGDQEIVEIAFHPTEPLRYAISDTGGVLRSRDQGASWQSLGGPLQGASFSGASSTRPRSRLFFGFQDPDEVLLSSTRFPSPAWLFAPGDPADEGNRFDGLAFSNNSDFEVQLDLTQSSGGAAQPAGLAEPAGDSAQVLSLGANQQLAQLRSELFSESGSAWLKLVSDGHTSAFFQYGTFDLAQLDGGVALQDPSRRLIFPLVLQGANILRGEEAQTRVSLFNPGDEAVEVEVRYFPSTGRSKKSSGPAAAVQRVVPAGGFLDEVASQLLGSASLNGWLEVVTQEGRGILGFALIEFPGAKTQLGFNALIDDQSRRLFSAQFATAPGVLFTDLTLVNTTDYVRHATITAVLDDGTFLSAPVEIELQPRESLTREAGNLCPGGGFAASLIVDTDGDGVLGTVVFGDPVNLNFAAALALQSSPFSEAVFSQVASLPGVFFTGLAFFYPDTADDAPDGELTVQVFQPDGQMSGEAVRTLVPGQRLSVLVDELVPAARGQSGGYVVIRFTQTLIGQMLFGAQAPSGAIRLFSAVPPVGL